MKSLSLITDSPKKWVKFVPKCEGKTSAMIFELLIFTTTSTEEFNSACKLIFVRGVKVLGSQSSKNVFN